MIFKSLKENIISEFDDYIALGMDEDPEKVIEYLLGCIEDCIDNGVLNKQDTEEGFAIMMGKILSEVPDLLSYAIGDLFDELVDNQEDCLAYVFSQALISYTIRETVLYYHQNGLFTEDMLDAIGVTKEFLENPDNPYKKDISSNIDDSGNDPDLVAIGINQKYLH